jgi:hypothetical protein
VLGHVSASSPYPAAPSDPTDPDGSAGLAELTGQTNHSPKDVNVF